MNKKTGKYFTCSFGGQRNSLVFFAATDDGKSDCLISMYRCSWSLCACPTYSSEKQMTSSMRRRTRSSQRSCSTKQSWSLTGSSRRISSSPRPVDPTKETGTLDPCNQATINQSINQSINQKSINQSINQSSHNQSINQEINQSNDQSIDCSNRNSKFQIEIE